MNTPKVSVIMPNYNCEKYIGEAIESILNQTFTDFEFIIIDDCSTDNSWEIIQNFAKKDKRIIAIKNEKNLGITKNRNKLLSFTKGKYVIWQDSDDISINTRIEKQYNFMEQHNEVGVCGGGIEFFGENINNSFRLYYEKDKEIRKRIFLFSPISQGAAIYKRDIIQSVGAYNENIPTAEDLDLSFRIGMVSCFANLPEVVLQYRQHQSDTYKNLRKMEIETIKIRFKYNNNGYYKMNFVDYMYNFCQLATIYLMPIKIRIKLFTFFRNIKKNN